MSIPRFASLILIRLRQGSSPVATCASTRLLTSECAARAVLCCSRSVVHMLTSPGPLSFSLQGWSWCRSLRLSWHRGQPELGIYLDAGDHARGEYACPSAFIFHIQHSHAFSFRSVKELCLSVTARAGRQVTLSQCVDEGTPRNAMRWVCRDDGHVATMADDKLCLDRTGLQNGDLLKVRASNTFAL